MPWLLLYHDCVIQTLRDNLKQSHQQITTDTPYDDAQVDDRYEYPHVGEAAGSNLEKKDVFLENSYTGCDLFCHSSSVPTGRGSSGAGKGDTIPAGRNIRLCMASFFVLAENPSRCPPLMAFPNIPIRELHIVPCRLTTE